MITKKEIMQRLCNLEIEIDAYNEVIDDILDRIKKLEKAKKNVKVSK